MQDGLGLRQLRGWQPDGGTLSLKKDTGLEGVGNSDRRGAPMGVRISGVGILTTTLTPPPLWKKGRSDGFYSSGIIPALEEMMFVGSKIDFETAH